MLDPRIKKKILDAYDGANSDGNLYSREKLETFFGNFRSRFGPDQLKQLDGRELLERMHGRGDNDSLAYWLEFKYDAEEFPGTELGGIGGGNAFKFGIFYRRDAGTWLAGGPTPKGHEISVAEAIAVASKQRDQFLRGCELLEQLPIGADDAAYRQLQSQLQELAPDIADSAWGHKYFYLMFPDRLDDFHSPVWQRFYLLKALQLPPPEDGRYVCAGRYVAMSRELDLPMHNFTYCLRDAVGPMHDYWRIGIIDPTSGRNGWDLMRTGDCIAVCWPEWGDLSAVEPASLPQQAARFVTRIHEGDLVLACDVAKVFGIGRVTGSLLLRTRNGIPPSAARGMAVAGILVAAQNRTYRRPKPIVSHLPKSAVNILETERGSGSLAADKPAEAAGPIAAFARYRWSYPVDPGAEEPGHRVRPAGNGQNVLGGTCRPRLGSHRGVWEAVPGRVGGGETRDRRHQSAARLGALVLFSSGVRLRGLHRRLSAGDGRRSTDVQTRSGDIQATM